jgi:hypothetical protein
MRTRLPFAALLVSCAILIGWFVAQAAVPIPVAAKDEKKATADDRDELATKLMQRVTFDKPFDNVALKEVIEFLNDKHDLTILVDGKSFNPGAAVAAELVAKNAADEILNAQISVPVMKNVRLATILKHVADQVDGVYLLYPDHIKIVSTARAVTLTNPPVREYQAEGEDAATQETYNDIIRSIPLVNANFKEISLQDALREVELRTNRSIVLAPLAGDKAKTTITARFTNVPVDTAVATLAESAGLGVGRKGNVILVTTVERAKEFAPVVPANPFPFGIAPAIPGFNVDPQIEELKKKVAELEKTIEALKKK